MCFSATASFATAAATGTVGLLALHKIRVWREVPLAAMPVVFSIQQSIEGLLWLSLGGVKTFSAAMLANAFVFFALVFWPVYAPVSVGLVEDNPVRRMAMWGLAAAGIALAAYGAWGIATYPYATCVVGGSLSYRNGHLYPIIALCVYVACTCLPMLLSSHVWLRRFGVLIVAGLAVSTIFFLEAEVSVWCFFAAAGSVVLYGHFARSPLTQRPAAGAPEKA